MKGQDIGVKIEKRVTNTEMGRRYNLKMGFCIDCQECPDEKSGTRGKRESSGRAFQSLFTARQSMFELAAIYCWTK
jgi:hypothetical protein